MIEPVAQTSHQETDMKVGNIYRHQNSGQIVKILEVFENGALVESTTGAKFTIMDGRDHLVAE
jgi:hypothetical protein